MANVVNTWGWRSYNGSSGTTITLNCPITRAANGKRCLVVIASQCGGSSNQQITVTSLNGVAPHAEVNVATDTSQPGTRIYFYRDADLPSAAGTYTLLAHHDNGGGPNVYYKAITVIELMSVDQSSLPLDVYTEAGAGAHVSPEFTNPGAIQIDSLLQWGGNAPRASLIGGVAVRDDSTVDINSMSTHGYLGVSWSDAENLAWEMDTNGTRTYIAISLASDGPASRPVGGRTTSQYGAKEFSITGWAGEVTSADIDGVPIEVVSSDYSGSKTAVVRLPGDLSARLGAVITLHGDGVSVPNLAMQYEVPYRNELPAPESGGLTYHPNCLLSGSWPAGSYAALPTEMSSAGGPVAVRFKAPFTGWEDITPELLAGDAAAYLRLQPGYTGTVTTTLDAIFPNGQISSVTLAATVGGV